MSRKKPASDDTVLAFIAAVFPDAPALARAAFDEEHILKTATEKLAALQQAREALTALHRDIATVYQVAQRPSHPGAETRAMLIRLQQWLDRIDAALKAVR